MRRIIRLMPDTLLSGPAVQCFTSVGLQMRLTESPLSFSDTRPFTLEAAHLPHPHLITVRHVCASDCGLLRGR